jgi:ATP-dependent DNA helicase RecG
MSDQPQQEGETVELKKSLAQLKQGLVSMAAILNKHQAGTLWFAALKWWRPGAAACR